VIVGLRLLNGLPVADLGHSPNPPTPETRILVAVAPAVHGALDEAALSAKARVELCKCPSHGVALSLVVKAVALVLVLVAARAGVDAVLCLELLSELVDVDGLNIAADRVL